MDKKEQKESIVRAMNFAQSKLKDKAYRHPTARADVALDLKILNNDLRKLDGLPPTYNWDPLKGE